MIYDDDKKKLQEDIATNAEYSSELNDLVDKEGQPLDAIEQDQVSSDESEDDAKRQLREINEGDDNDKDAPFND
jgi:hypothetical protein